VITWDDDTTEPSGKEADNDTTEPTGKELVLEITAAAGTETEGMETTVTFSGVFVSRL